MSDLCALGALLRKFPEFYFDIGQYLLAKKYADWLESRFCQYRDYLSGFLSAPINKERILEALQLSLSQSVPAYRNLSEIKDFHDIPFCEKNSLSSDAGSFVPRDIDEKDLWCIDTFGTTGQPVTVLYSSRFYFEYLYLTIRKTLYTAGIRSFEKYPIFCICVDNSRNGKEFITVDPTGDTGFSLRLLIDESDGTTLARFFHLVESLKPAVITTRPSIFEALIAYSSTIPNKLRFSPLCVISAGSFLSEAVRQETQELFGTKVFNCYGLTEFGLVACECSEQNGYHIDETSVIVEVLDPTGHPIKDGLEGEIVLSSFANEAMPLLRFKTGDLGFIDQSHCPCGCPGPRIIEIKGRRAFHYQFTSGALLHPVRFNCLYWLFPITEFQVIQISPNQIEVLIEPSSTCDDEDSLISRVQSYIKNMLPFRVELVVRKTRFKQGHKFERYVTRVKGPTSNKKLEVLEVLI